MDAHWAATYNQELRRVLNVPPSVELEFKSSRPGPEPNQAVAVFDAVEGSEDAALAAACAHRQGNEQFWAYHERLFQEADRLREGRPLLLTLASDAGLELAFFRRCIAERQGLIDVAGDLDEAERLGVEVTPTFFVNGRPVYGFVRPEYFFYIIEQELAAAPQP